MKLAPLLLIVSCLANAALLGALALRPTLAPPAWRNLFLSDATRAAQAADESHAIRARVTARAEAARARAAAEQARLWAKLRADDLPSLIAHLRAAGFPAAVIREIVRVEVNARFDGRMRALIDPDPSVPFWKLSTNFFGPGDKRMEEYNQLQRERSKLLRELFSDPALALDDASAGWSRQYGNLSRQKIDQVQRIEDDYAEMISTIRAAMNGITLPEDREKLALLAREKHADLAAVLTPEELADFELRTSPITRMMRDRLGNFDASEAEFRAIVGAQQAFSDKFGGSGPRATDFGLRRTAQQELDAQLKAGLGPARYADYLRETSSEFQQLTRLAQRDQLPADAALRAYNVRDTVALESNRIADDAARSADEKRAALQALAQNTRNQLLTLLGPSAGPAYVKIVDQWLTTVERGNAVTFGSGGSGSITSFSNDGVTVTFGGNGANFRGLIRPPAPPPRP